MADYLKFIFLDTAHFFVGKSEILYKLWFFFVLGYIKGKKKRLPQKNDDFYFDGYPRSGNTYTNGLLMNIYGQLNGISHLHSKTGLKIAIRKKIPAIIIIRKPSDAVVSELFRKISNGSKVSEKMMINILLKKYIRYYSCIELNIDNILLITFEKFINNQPEYIHALSIKLGLEFIEIEELKKLVTKYEAYLKEKEKIKNDAVSSLPNKARKKFKNSRKKLVTDSKYYHQSVQLYSNLIVHDMLVKPDRMEKENY